MTHATTLDVVLRLEQVAKSYGAGDAATVVLNGVDLVLHAGEKASLMGPSGSGKSTLLGIIAGLIRPDRGCVHVGGRALADADERERAELRAREVGIALQSANLIPFLSARENVELAMAFGGTTDRRARAQELLGDLRVAHRADHLPRQLSGGEVQRVALAVALANRPSVLLADEIAGLLDSRTAEHVVDLVLESDLAVLFVTHDAGLADRAPVRLRLRDQVVQP